MNKLKKLRNLYKFYNLDGYIVPKNDEFFGEYVNKKNDRLNYISLFSGSAGSALILKKSAYLFVDGRYTLQAKKEADQNFKIVEIHKTRPSQILKKINKKLIIGFDPKLFSENNLKQNFFTINTKFVPIKKNLVDLVWNNKPKVQINKFFTLSQKYTGDSHRNKIKKISSILKKNKINKLLVTAPENLAWILNIRGNDSKYSPLPNCHAIIDSNGQITLIVNKNKISNKFRSSFKKIIKIIEPSYIVKYFRDMSAKEVFFIDKLTCCFFYKKEIEKKFKFVEKIDPIYFLKAKKNKTEINNTIKSHLYDGIALTKFIYWIKNNVRKYKITEISAEKKLEKFRKQNNKYKFPSFNTISGTGPNGAIVHYRANKKTNRIINKNDIYLCDSGGQYHYGTTDVTRTMCFSNQPKREKNIYTKVLKGHIGGATFNLKKTTTGKKIDFIARKPLKKIGLDYAHGTGHGVGYFLNVHEGPQAISKINNIKLEEGMILSNEPGYYEKDKFGIRIENLLYTKKIKNKLKFENLTLAPIEKNLINFNLLKKSEKKYLNNYHEKVYAKLSPYLETNEKIWLKSFFN